MGTPPSQYGHLYMVLARRQNAGSRREKSQRTFDESQGEPVASPEILGRCLERQRVAHAMNPSPQIRISSST